MSTTAIVILQGLPLAVVLLILYFAFIWPQKRSERAYKKMLEGLQAGDQIVTDGGFYEQVIEVLDEATIVLQFAPTFQIKAKRQAVSELVAKGEAGPVATAGCIR